MKKLFSIALVALALTGCTTAPFMPSTGALYSNNKAPLQLEYNNTDLGHKVGQASSHSFVGLFAFGDTSVRAGTLIPVMLDLGDIKTKNFMLVQKVTHRFDDSEHTMDLVLEGAWE